MAQGVAEQLGESVAEELGEELGEELHVICLEMEQEDMIERWASLILISCC